MNSEDASKLPLNCPTCGRSLRFVDANSPIRLALKTDRPADSTFFVFECSEHGLHDFGARTRLTAGPSPTRHRGSE